MIIPTLITTLPPEMNLKEVVPIVQIMHTARKAEGYQIACAYPQSFPTKKTKKAKLAYKRG